MRTLAFVGQKGGSGKSTLGASIGVAAQEDSERPFLIDLDPQGTLHSWGSRREAEPLPLTERGQLNLRPSLALSRRTDTPSRLLTRKARISRRLRR